jgi:DNA-binding beta-propeller fold protein YncE
VAYRETADWAQLPIGITFAGSASSVAVGADGRIYVFNRGPQRMVVLDADGGYAGGWGDAADYVRPHGVTACVDGDLLLVDVGAHVVDKVRADGKRVLRLGTPGRHSPAYSGEPFNQPTDAVEHPVTRDIFVADGYANSRIHHYDAEGRHIRSWGEPGSGPGRLSNPHGLCLLNDDHLAVCDRENHRVQVFDLDGGLVESRHTHRPSAVRRRGELLYIAELGPPAYMHGSIPDMGSCVTVTTLDGTVVDRLGGRYPGLDEGSFLSPHGMAVSPEGVVYVAEVNAVYLQTLGLPVPPQDDLPSLRRWSPHEGERST